MILLMRGDDDGRTASSMQPNQELRPVAAEDVSPETEGGLPASRQPLAGLLASVFAPFGATPRRAAVAGRRPNGFIFYDGAWRVPRVPVG